MDVGRDAFDFVEQVERLSESQDVVERLAETIKPFGLDKVILTGLPDEKFDEAVLGQHWPTAHLDLYARENYVRFSPLVRRCRGSSAPFVWHAEEFADEQDPRAAKVLEANAAHGILCGFLTPIHSIKGFDACVAMAGERIEVPPRARPALHLMALYAFERLRALRGGAPSTTACRKRSLTPREREVLTWIAQGKTAWEVGEILSIAKRTVDEHVQTAARKLGAKNRTHAVALALRAGSVSL